MKIRLWQLGSLEHQIAPTREGVKRLTDILNNHKLDKEPFDLIWGPDLKVKIIDDADEDIVLLNEENAKKFLELRGYKVTKSGFFKGI